MCSEMTKPWESGVCTNNGFSRKALEKPEKKGGLFSFELGSNKGKGGGLEVGRVGRQRTGGEGVGRGMETVETKGEGVDEKRGGWGRTGFV